MLVMTKKRIIDETSPDEMRQGKGLKEKGKGYIDRQIAREREIEKKMRKIYRI